MRLWGFVTMIRFQFNEKKTTQVAALFLKKAGGRMNYMKLIKLLYLVDRKALEKWECPITGDSYFSMTHGPVLSKVFDFITHEADPVSPSIWYTFIKKLDYDVELIKASPEDELSRREISLIDELFQKYKSKSEWDLVKELHDNFPEWENPEGSSIPIRVEDIFKVLGKTERDIRIIESETNAYAFAKGLLHR